MSGDSPDAAAVSNRARSIWLSDRARFVPEFEYTWACQAVVVDGHGRNVTVNGADGINKVVPGSGWPFLHPGSNSLTITGGTGTFDHVPLYS